MTLIETYERAQRAVKFGFFFMAVPIGVLVPRLAEIKEAVGAADAAYGTAIAIGGMGALLGNFVGSRLVHRLGSRGTARLSIVLLVSANISNALVNTVFLLALVAFASGFTYAATNIAMNSQGVLVEKAIGRSFMPKAHGYWSLGAMTFAILSSLAAPYISPLVALLVGASISLIGFQWGSHYLLETKHEDLPADDPTQLQRHERIPTTALQFLIILAVGQWLALIAEIAVGDWSSVLLHDHFNIPIGPNGYAYSAFMVVQLSTRMLSSKYIDRFGLIQVVRTLGLIGSTGFVILLFAGNSLRESNTTATLVLSCLAYGFIALGVATMPPAFYTAIGRIPGLPSARALMITGAIVSVLNMFGRITIAALTNIFTLPAVIALTGLTLFIAANMTKALDPKRIESHAISK